MITIWSGIILFSLIIYLWALTVPAFGDDLLYMYRYNDFSMEGPWIAPLRNAWAIWLNTNARTGDMANFLWLNILPRQVTALLISAAVCATFYGMLQLINNRKKNTFISACATLILMAGMPWWDMDYYVCHFCYVWGTAGIGLVLTILLCHKPKSKLWLMALPIVFAIGATHEALGFPLGVGLTIYLWVNRHTIQHTTVQKWWIAALMAAALFCISSPASYQRLGNTGAEEHHDTALLLTSILLPAALFMRIALLCSRKQLLPLTHTRWLLFAVTAFISTGFAIIGGIEGRASWYADFFSLLALGYDFNMHMGHKHYKLPIRKATIAVGILCIIYPIFDRQSTTLITSATEKQKALLIYREYPNEYATHKYLEKVLPTWSVTCMPLTRGESISSPNFSYAPKYYPKNVYTMSNPCLWRFRISAYGCCHTTEIYSPEFGIQH